MTVWKTLTSRSGLARQVLTMKPDVKFAKKIFKFSNMERQALVCHANIKKHTRIYLTVDNLFSNQEKRQCIMLNKRRCPCQMVDLTIHDLARRKEEIAWSLKSVCSGFSNNSTSNINQVFNAMFPDNKIAKSFHIGPDKLKYICNFRLAPFLKTILAKK